MLRGDLRQGLPETRSGEAGGCRSGRWGFCLVKRGVIMEVNNGGYVIVEVNNSWRFSNGVVGGF